jgi:Flp pilus assembly protein TadG
MKQRITAPLHARRGDARGQVLVLFALMLIVLLLISALAVDYGGWLVTRRNYQNVTDAASLAGAQQLTRGLAAGCASGGSKQFCAREAAWESVKTALNFTLLNPTTQAATSSSANGFYTENGYKVWVASPPSDAGAAYPGHVSGTGASSGLVFVRVDHQALDYLSRLAAINRNVTAWSTAGRFPANFAVVGMCSPTSITANCLAGDANIKLDGTNTNLIVNTGDLGTNRWVKDGGSSSGVALGADSNAYMQLFDTCWGYSTTQCQLWGSTGTGPDTSQTYSAIPLGAPIPDPAYPAPTINSTTAPNQCRGTGTVSLASAKIVERPGQDGNVQISDLPAKLASAVQPILPLPVVLGAGFNISGQVTAATGGALLGNITIQVLDSTQTVVSSTTTPNNGGNKGTYSFNNIAAGTYTVRASDSTNVYFPSTLSVTVGPDATNKNFVLNKSPIVTGTVRSSTTSALLSGVSITVTALGINYTTTTNASGVYSLSVPQAGATVNFTIVGTLTNYTSGGSTVNAPTAVDQTYTRDFTLTPAPASVSGTVTDAVTGLGVPGVTITLGSGGSATSAGTYGAYAAGNGAYNISVATPGSQTVTLSGSSLTGYAYATPTSGSTVTINAGSNTLNFTVWPYGCDNGGSTNYGNWSCSFPSTHCASVTNATGVDVNCNSGTFTQAFAIRPGTYDNITLPNNTCAWIDPTGGATGLPTGQLAGIVHIKGTLSVGNNSYLFGDGVTIVMDQGSSTSWGNSSGFVLNYGTLHSTATNPASACAYTNAKAYKDGYYPCFRTVNNSACAASTANCHDYAYAAWTTNGSSPWQTNTGSGCAQASTPVYNTTGTTVGNLRCFTPGTDLGITWYLHGSGLGNASRFVSSSASYGFLFNGVLYGPNDDLNIGGGSNNQTAAGQIVGWTIEYHGGTAIQQNWYGDPKDGQPFLVEPVLGE